MKQETQDYLDRVTTGLVKVAGMVREDTTDALSTGDHVIVIGHFDRVRKATETIKLAKKAIEEIEDRLSKEHVPDVMRAHKIKTTTIEGIGRVTISNKFSCSMLDKETGFKWLRDNGHEGLIQETVNSSTLSAFAKELLEDSGMDMPPEIFKVGMMTYTSITKK